MLHVLTDEYLNSLDPTVNYLEGNDNDGEGIKGIPLELLNTIIADIGYDKNHSVFYRLMKSNSPCKQVFKDYYLNTCIDTCIQQYDFATKLLDMGANPNYMINYRSTFYSFIMSWNIPHFHISYEDITKIRISLLNKFIQKGADIHCKCYNTPFQDSILCRLVLNHIKVPAEILFNRMDPSHSDVQEIFDVIFGNVDKGINLDNFEIDMRSREFKWFLDIYDKEIEYKDKLKPVFNLIPKLSIPPEWSIPIFTTAFKRTEGYILGYKMRSDSTAI